jgi:hypothetical protein
LRIDLSCGILTFRDCFALEALAVIHWKVISQLEAFSEGTGRESFPSTEFDETLVERLIAIIKQRTDS